MAGEPTEKSLFLHQKKFGGGKSQKCKGTFSGGARSSFAGTGGGAWLALRAKMGSSDFVKSHQKWIFQRFQARCACFFFGCAERKPDVFRGEMGFGARREPRFFVRRKRRFLVK